MQGGIAEEAPRPTLLERLTECYENRMSLTEFISFTKVSTPESSSRAMDKIRMNWERFAFYYVALFCVFDLLFIFLHRLIIIPIAITVAAIFIAAESFVVAGATITPFHTIVGCLLIHIIICVAFASLAKVYVYFFALNAFALLLVLAHGSLVDADVAEDDISV